MVLGELAARLVPSFFYSHNLRLVVADTRFVEKKD